MGAGEGGEDGGRDLFLFQKQAPSFVFFTAKVHVLASISTVDFMCSRRLRNYVNIMAMME